MNDALKMFLVLTGTSAVCGLLLAVGNDLTHTRIEIQQLRYVQGPAIQTVLAGSTNDPLVDRKTVSVSGKPVMLFFGKKGDALTGVALETAAMGYRNELRVVSGFDPVSGNCTSVALSVASETPGIGSRVADTSFTHKFAGLPIGTAAALRKDGGTIDAMGGATISSRGFCRAVAEAQKLFGQVKPTLSGGSK